MSNDSHLFRTRDQLEEAGWSLLGNTFSRGSARMLPLYEAKMFHHFDHRWATYEPDGSTRLVGPEEKVDPEYLPMPRYWVGSESVDKAMGSRVAGQRFMGFRNVTNSTNERTVIASSLPRVAVGNSAPLLFTDADPDCLEACLSSMVLDYVLRLKLGGTNLNFHYVQQLPVPPPQSFEVPAPWDATTTIAAWLKPRVAELSNTSSASAEWGGPPFRWDPARRRRLRAEIDAAFFMIYGLSLREAHHVFDSFPILQRKEIAEYGTYAVKELTLSIYEEMKAASRP